MQLCTMIWMNCVYQMKLIYLKVLNSQLYYASNNVDLGPQNHRPRIIKKIQHQNLTTIKRQILFRSLILSSKQNSSKIDL